jgi:hypothetical protein
MRKPMGAMLTLVVAIQKRIFAARLHVRSGRSWRSRAPGADRIKAPGRGIDSCTHGRSNRAAGTRVRARN